MSDLMARLKKASTLDDADVLETSEFFNARDNVRTDVPMLNVALSGSIDRGLSSGLTLIAGESKHYKSLLGIKMMSAYMKAHPDSVVLFYDSEHGASKQYFSANGIDTRRVLHVPIKNVEEFKFDVMKQLEEANRGDKIFIFIDSIGNLASKKEMEDALEGKSVADMTRAKQLKSVFRMVTPYLSSIDIPMVAINHVYDTQGLFAKKVVGGGQGIYLSASTIFIMGRRQNKKGTEIEGYDFIINIEKSRAVRENSKIPITVSYEEGLNNYSGLLDVAIESGFVDKPKNGWYTRPGVEDDKNWRAADTSTEEFWTPILEDENFNEWIKRRYLLGYEPTAEEVIDDE